MKNNIILSILTLCLQLVNAQEFEETAKYKAFSEIVTKQQEYGPINIAIKTSGDNPENIATLTLDEPDIFEGVYISTLSDSGLEGVKEVIKVEMVYSACCAHVQAYYYLVTNNGRVLDLPRVENTYCNGSESDMQFIFPNQEYGKEGTIVRANTHYGLDSIDNIEIIQSYYWNDDDFYFKEGGVASTID